MKSLREIGTKSRIVTHTIDQGLSTFNKNPKREM